MRKGGKGDQMKLKIEYVDVNTLKTYENNAKIHDAAQIEQIKRSITDFGFNDPIAVWKNNVIIEGHGRYFAAKELGIPAIPIIRLDTLSDEERKAYGLIHNKLTMDTGFDYDTLREELDGMSIDASQYGFDIDFEDEKEYAIENREYSPGDFDDEKFEYECPECGFRFNE